MPVVYSRREAGHPCNLDTFLVFKNYLFGYITFQTIPFNTSSYPDMFVGVIAASVAVDISPDDSYDDSYKDMKKYMTVQLPIKGKYVKFSARVL